MATDNTRWQAMLESMIGIRKSKLEGWSIDLVRRFPKLQTLEAMTYLGSFAWSQPHTRKKIIRTGFAYDLGGGFCSPADIARDYISAKFQGERLRCNSKQYDDFVRNRIHQPLYCEPVTGMDAYYVDLKSAYWQILMCGGWDVDYSRNSFLSVRSDMFDFPVPHLKLARNTLVSIGLPSQSTVYHPEKGFMKMKGGGGSVNLVLYGFVQDFLHCFAHEMIERALAVYVNTDGYIIPKQSLNEAMKIAEEWNVLLTVRYSGVATVRRVGDYDIQNYRSPRPATTTQPRKYIHIPDLKWFKKRWNFFSHRIDMDYSPLMSLSELTESDEID